jgi:hypothetical protein
MRCNGYRPDSYQLLEATRPSHGRRLTLPVTVAHALAFAETIGVTSESTGVVVILNEAWF